MAQDPDRITYRVKKKEDAVCLQCQKVFKSPDKTRVRRCPKCKQTKSRSQDYDQPVKRAPDDH